MTRNAGRSGDPADGRVPTSHERRTGASWDASYRNGPAPWDIGYPQPAVVRLSARGAFTGTVLDAGCGSGEHTLLIASLGYSVVGVDVAETALAIARERAGDRKLTTDFVAADALHLDAIGRVFDSVLDCGLFHTLDREERVRYAASLATVTKRGGRLYVLCFSDTVPDTGPHPITRNDIDVAFTPAAGWQVDSIDAERLHTRFHDAAGAPAWLATITRGAGTEHLTG